VTEIELARDRAARAEALLVGLDFDGVLAEIVARPEDATPVPGVIPVLTRLVGLDGVRVAAVSGRRRDDLAERLSPPAGVILIGEHGADAGDQELPSPAGYEDVRAVLEKVAERYDGAWVEEKKTGLTIHGRALEADAAIRMAEDAERALEPLVPGRFERGNRIVDVRLTGSTKGAALLALRDPGEVVVFIGDDTTDETVFAVLGSHDVGVKVGPGETAAAFRLPDPAAVVTFLEDLVAARSR
jgi:trehalose 6-phosphate phosphatase